MYLLCKSCAVFLLLLLISSCGITDSTQETDEKLLDDSYLTYSDWHLSSVPQYLNNHWNKSDSILIKHRGNVFWYNLNPSSVKANEIFDNVSESTTLPCLDFVYNPIKRGLYNSNTKYTYSDTSWGGTSLTLKNDDILKVSENFSTTYLSIWIKYEINSSLEYFFIDLGEISEDIIPNMRFDTEDHNFNDRLDDNEDTGLDGFFDKDEFGFDENNNTDPSNDNYSFDESFNDYSKVNFHENNSILDSEDINGNYSLDKANNYYSYQIQLDRNKNKYISESKETGWLEYNIPLSEFKNVIGTPNIDKLETLRIWFYGRTEGLQIKIAELKFIVK